MSYRGQEQTPLSVYPIIGMPTIFSTRNDVVVGNYGFWI